MKTSELGYDELYELVVTKGKVEFDTKPRRIDLILALDEIEPKLDIEINE